MSSINERAEELREKWQRMQSSMFGWNENEHKVLTVEILLAILESMATISQQINFLRMDSRE